MINYDEDSVRERIIGAGPGVCRSSRSLRTRRAGNSPILRSSWTCLTKYSAFRQFSMLLLLLVLEFFNFRSSSAPLKCFKYGYLTKQHCSIFSDLSVSTFVIYFNGYCCCGFSSTYFWTALPLFLSCMFSFFQYGLGSLQTSISVHGLRQGHCRLVV